MSDNWKKPFTLSDPAQKLQAGQCGLLKLMDSIHTASHMFTNAVKTQFNQVKLTEQVEELIESINTVWQAPKVCREQPTSAKCKTKLNNPKYIAKRKMVDAQLATLHKVGRHCAWIFSQLCNALFIYF
jgi:hypothetical protein